MQFKVLNPYSSTSILHRQQTHCCFPHSQFDNEIKKISLFWAPTNFQDLLVQQDDGLLFKRRFFNQFLLLFLSCSLHHVFLDADRRSELLTD